MEYRRFNDNIVIRMDRGDEIVSAISQIAEKENIKLGFLAGIGAAGNVTAGILEIESKQYKKHAFTGDFEIVSVNGNVTRADNKPYIHLHVALADIDGNVIGGHLNEAYISGTGEMVLTVLDGETGRRKDEVTGLNVFDFN